MLSFFRKSLAGVRRNALYTCLVIVGRARYFLHIMRGCIHATAQYAYNSGNVFPHMPLNMYIQKKRTRNTRRESSFTQPCWNQLVGEHMRRLTPFRVSVKKFVGDVRKNRSALLYYYKDDERRDHDPTFVILDTSEDGFRYLTL